MAMLNYTTEESPMEAIHTLGKWYLKHDHFHDIWLRKYDMIACKNDQGESSVYLEP